MSAFGTDSIMFPSVFLQKNNVDWAIYIIRRYFFSRVLESEKPKVKGLIW